MIIHDNEHLARFISIEGWFNNGQVKGEAFRPRKDHGQFKTSVTRHDGTNKEEIKKRGDTWMQMPRKNPLSLFGWADVIAGAVRTVSTIPALDIEADAGNKRDPYHANIIGWDLEIGRQMLQAEEVARQSKLVLI